MIEAALVESNGKIAGPNGAAAKLGIPPSTLDSKIKQYNIAKRKFGASKVVFRLSEIRDSREFVAGFES